MKDWMKTITDKKRMRDILLPGSHDAGMVLNKMTEGWLANKANAGTQKLDIKAQLEAGVRWLDIRIEHDMLCFHSSAKGVNLDEVCKDIISFLDENLSEVVIVLLTKSHRSVYTIFLNKLNELSKKSFPPLFHIGHDNQLANVHLNSLRGRVVVVMDKPPEPEEVMDTSKASYRIIKALLKKDDAEHLFNKETILEFDQEKAALKYGLVLNTVGSYSGHSSVSTILTTQQNRATNIKSIDASFMAVYYSTNTSEIGVRWHSIEHEDAKMWSGTNVTTMLDNATQAKVNGGPVFNCVMMDFVTPERCGMVIDRAAKFNHKLDHAD